MADGQTPRGLLGVESTSPRVPAFAEAFAEASASAAEGGDNGGELTALHPLAPPPPDARTHPQRLFLGHCRVSTGRAGAASRPHSVPMFLPLDWFPFIHRVAPLAGL